MKLVMTSGAYDVLHVGHLRHLVESRGHGDRLVVALNSDASVRRRKGPSRPIHREADRLEMLLGLRCVDEVLLFDEDTPVALIDRLRPALFTVGPDYRIRDVAGLNLITSYGGQVLITSGQRTISTTSILALR